MKGADDDELRRTVELAKALPTKVPGPARRQEVRALLLAQAALEPVRARGRAPWVVGVAAVAAAVGLWLAAGRPERPRSHVVVRPSAGARYELASPPPWETIRLWEGEIELDVQPLGPHDRVRVAVGDDEVEVRGTLFRVVARGERLVGVSVSHGRVEVRPAGGALAVLAAGQSWRAPSGVAAPTRLPASAALEPEARAPVPARAPAVHAQRVAVRAEAGVERALRPTRQEALYDDAWDALRARRFHDAAAGFARVLAEAPTGPLADEASFWRATSLARGGDPTRAAAAFQEFLASYRASPRAGEASAILGWLLVDANRAEEAAGWFHAALRDPHEPVRTSAREGLDAVARARH